MGLLRELSNRINEDAAPGDVVSGVALRDRVKRTDGSKKADRLNKPNNANAFLNPKVKKNP